MAAFLSNFLRSLGSISSKELVLLSSSASLPSPHDSYVPVASSKFHTETSFPFLFSCPDNDLSSVSHARA